jgi:hypothetical protein
VRPRKCPWLTRCPAGTTRPAFSAGVFVFLIAAVLTTVLSYLYVAQAGREQDRRAARAEEQVCKWQPSKPPCGHPAAVRISLHLYLCLVCAPCLVLT